MTLTWHFCGHSSYPALQHEIFLYIFDFAPIYGCFLLLCIFHFGFYALAPEPSQKPFESVTHLVRPAQHRDSLEQEGKEGREGKAGVPKVTEMV